MSHSPQPTRAAAEGDTAVGVGLGVGVFGQQDLLHHSSNTGQNIRKKGRDVCVGVCVGLCVYVCVCVSEGKI